jgi:hypothetical protein
MLLNNAPDNMNNILISCILENRAPDFVASCNEDAKCFYWKELDAIEQYDPDKLPQICSRSAHS